MNKEVMDLHLWRWTELRRVAKEKTKDITKEKAKEENGLQPEDIYVEKVVDVDSKEMVKEKESRKKSPRARTKQRKTWTESVQ